MTANIITVKMFWCVSWVLLVLGLARLGLWSVQGLSNKISRGSIEAQTQTSKSLVLHLTNGHAGPPVYFKLALVVMYLFPKRQIFQDYS